MSSVDFGYPAQPGVAGDTPGIADSVRRSIRTALAAGAPVALVLVVAAFALLAQGGPLAALGVFVGILAGVSILLLSLWIRARRKELRVLSLYPWREWPCATKDVRVIAAVGERAGGRRWGTAGRVTLLAPDGQSVCSFPLPGNTIRDRVWFAGDPRYGGMLAAPGGMPSLWVSREKPGRLPADAADDDLARRAGLRR